ncbi:hypothetical protein FRB90_012640 [Tulasnella sp. 427]|nr:hypothetical protein FRB90_012640 [Tulasnella sp. 427]
MLHRSTYSGSEAKLVIAIDIGTTFSGASYTFLRPGEEPRIFDVTGYKGQENRESNSKVPSVLLYKEDGTLVACGAETKRFKNHNGIRTKMFKLELRPPSQKIDVPQVELPQGKAVVDVLSDFLGYIHDCVRTRVGKTHVDGDKIWDSLRGSAHFVLSHPNGWGSRQQKIMRKAAILAGLVPDTPEGNERIEFVTEGEASFHWCVEQAIAEDALKEDTRIVVADSGGGTIDVSSFTVTTTKPLRLKEMRAPDCALEGSITVTERFVNSMRSKLRSTKYGDDDYMETLCEEFDDETKCLFCDQDEGALYIQIGLRRDHYHDENNLCNIEFGLLEVHREEVVQAFEPSVKAIVKAIRNHLPKEGNAVCLSQR